MRVFATRTRKALRSFATRTRKALRRAGRVAVFLALTALLWSVTSASIEPTSADDPVLLPAFDAEQPVLIVVRGWLWDPESRSQTGPLQEFPQGLQTRLDGLGLQPQLYEYPWSRVPSDLAGTARQFEEFAWEVSRWGEANSQCVSFAGHSAGAVMVYRAAARGVPMGLMATIGNPLPGPKRPEDVFHWVDAYTSTHERDLPGRLWGGTSGADRSIDTGTKHKDLWGSDAVMDLIADGLVRSWQGCRG